MSPRYSLSQSVFTITQNMTSNRISFSHIYSLNHAHLLPVLGYSCDGPRLCLIYPFMANGSLDSHLHNTDNLTPEVRVQVACDVASALAYLHGQAENVIVHRDVKRYITSLRNMYMYTWLSLVM